MENVNVNVEEMKLNANGEELTIEEKLFGRKLKDDEFVQVKWGDLREAAKDLIDRVASQSVESTLNRLDEWGLIDKEEAWKLFEENRLSCN